MSPESRLRAVGLVLHPTKPVADSVAAVVAFAGTHDVQVLAREQDKERVPPEVSVVGDAEFVDRADGVVALGGDGTMLGAMRLVAARPVPVLGVNHGNLGFLVEIPPARLPWALDRLAEQDVTIERHDGLVVSTDGAELGIRLGFNDVVISRAQRTGAVSVDLTVNDLHYGFYRGDAVVVATPTGSTAYNYAAGGPVLSPSSRTLVITPVAPMAGIARPVVLGADDRIALTVAPDSTAAAVEVDGIDTGELGPGDTLTTALRQDAAHVVRFAATDHASLSWVKLSLLDLPLRPDQLLELIPAEMRRGAAESLPERFPGVTGP